MLGEFFQHIDRGGDDLSLAVLHWLGQLHLVEEYVAELLRGIDIEAVGFIASHSVADLFVDAFGKVIDLKGETSGHAAEEFGINAYAGLLHAEEDRN